MNGKSTDDSANFGRTALAKLGLVAVGVGLGILGCFVWLMHYIAEAM